MFVDDNRPFYTLEKFDEYNDEDVAMEVDGFVGDSPTDLDNPRRKILFFSATLYKHVYMEADGADVIFDGFLDLLKDYLPGLFRCNDGYVIKRVYLATSNNYKHYHIVSAKTLDEKYYYSRS